jgi:hypothetical protein
MVTLKLYSAETFPFYKGSRQARHFFTQSVCLFVCLSPPLSSPNHSPIHVLKDYVHLKVISTPPVLSPPISNNNMADNHEIAECVDVGCA